MKAILCKAYNTPPQLFLEEVADPVPGAGELLIEIKACGVNFPDTLIIQGLYQLKPPLPFSPGSDVAGIVSAVGPEVNNFRIGDEVFGFIPYGGFAEKAIVPAATCFRKLPEMDFTVAASFMMAYGTSYHALKDRAHLKKGEKLLVLGAAGGVGLAAVELGNLMGAHVIAAASTDEKLEICKKYGAKDLINYSRDDIKTKLKTLTNGKGVDVVYDPVGGKYTEAALRAMAWEGRYLVIGFAAGEIPKIPLNIPLLKSCDIVGVFWGSFAHQFPAKNLENSRQLLQWYSEKKLQPNIHQTYPLEDALKAIEAMRAREVKGKIVITV